MIYSLRGVVQEISPTYIVLEVRGVGYYLGVSLSTSKVFQKGQDVFLYTQQIVREDAHLLFGFAQKEEKELFNLLISVSGVGSASALIMLSSLERQEIIQAILSGNSGLLQKVKGIGTKTAQRIIIELKDKIQKFEQVAFQENAISPNNKVLEESLSALEVLGISKKLSEKLANKIIKDNQDISTEDLVKQILKNI